MEERLYLILDSQGTPLANAVLESPLNAEVLQIRILNNKDQMVIQPTAALGPAARENLRILTDFESVMYPVSGRWRGQLPIKAKDLSCGGIAFWSPILLEDREIVEMVLPVTDSPVVVRAQMIRQLKDESSQLPLYAAKFVDLIQDEEALIRKAVFSIQISAS